MASINSLMIIIKDPKERRLRILKTFRKWMSEEAYITSLYKLKVGRELDLANPRTYTEKIQWLKLYDRNPKYTMMQDKYLVREYVSKMIGDEYLIPLLGVWERVDDIDFNSLPNQFVLKCNHDCASVIICRDKTSFNVMVAKEKLNRCLKRDYSIAGGEWAYRDIKRRIIAEQYMHDNNEKTLNDYKFFCFSGKAKIVMITSGEAHTKERRLDFYDMDFNPLDIRRGEMLKSGQPINKPLGIDELIPLVEKIADGIPFVRVDFYLINGHPYFGEIAFYPSSGFAEFSPYEWEERIGSWIELPV